jgi:serine protease Do
MKNWYVRAGIALFMMVFMAGSALFAQETDSRVIVSGGAWLGVYLDDAGAENSWDDAEGAVIQEVVKDGPADKAGLREGDVIIKLQDRTVRDADDVTRDIRKMKPGDKVQIQVLRDGKKITLAAELQEREKTIGIKAPAREKRLERLKELKPLPGFWLQSNRRLGVGLQEMDSDLAGYFEVTEGEGVLVTDVEKGNVAEKAGLKSGDVITAVNGKAVTEIGDVTSALEEGESDEYQITFMRKGRKEEITVKLPEREPLNLHLRLNGDDWPFSRETMKDLREDLEKLRDELDELKIKLEIEVDKK